MSVIIRLQGLPWTASSLDIRNFFHGLSIPPGGVHIIGGSKGEAFIAFSTDEDARKAMMFNFMPLNGCVMQLFLSSKSEMQCVIEQAQNPSDQTESYPKPSLTPQTQQRSDINEFESRERGTFRQDNSYNYNRPDFGNTDSKNEQYPQLGRYEDQSNNGSFGRNNSYQNEQSFDTHSVQQQTSFNTLQGLNNYQRDLPLRQGYVDEPNVTQMYPAVQEIRNSSVSPSRLSDQNRQYPVPPMFQGEDNVLPTYSKDVPSKEVRKPDKERSVKERGSRSERSDVRDSDRRSERERSNRDRDRDRDRERERDRDRSRGSRNDRCDRNERSDRNDKSDRSRGSDKSDRDRDRDRISREGDSRSIRDRSDIRKSRDNDRSDQKEPKSSSSAVTENIQSKPNYPKYDTRQEMMPNNRNLPFIEDNLVGLRQDMEDFSQTGLVDPATLFSKEMQANAGPGFGQKREQQGMLPGDWRSESAHSFPIRTKDDNTIGETRKPDKRYDGNIDRDPDYRQRHGGMQSTNLPPDVPWNNMSSDADFRSSQGRRGDFDSRGRIQREKLSSEGNQPGIGRRSLIGESDVSSAKGLLGDAPPGHGGVMPVSGPFGGPGFGGDGPGFNRDGPAFNRDGPAFNRDGPAFNRDGSGFNRDGPGYKRDGSAFNRDGAGFNRDGPGFNREAPGFRREGSDPNQDVSGFNRDGPGVNRDRPGLNRDGVPGFNRDGGPAFNRDGPSYNRDGPGMAKEGQGYNGPNFNRNGSGFNRDDSGFNKDGTGDGSVVSSDVSGFKRDGPSHHHREGPGFNRDGPGFNIEDPGFNKEYTGFNRDGQGLNREGTGFNRGGPGFNRDGHKFNRDGPAFHRDGPGFNRDGPGFNRDEPGFNRDGPGFNRDGPGFNRDGPAFERDGSGFERDAQGFERDGSGFERDAQGFERDAQGFERDAHGFNRDTPGFNRNGPVPGIGRDGKNFKRDGSGFTRDGTGFPRVGSDRNRDGPVTDRERLSNCKDVHGPSTPGLNRGAPLLTNTPNKDGLGLMGPAPKEGLLPGLMDMDQRGAPEGRRKKEDGRDDISGDRRPVERRSAGAKLPPGQTPEISQKAELDIPMTLAERKVFAQLKNLPYSATYRDIRSFFHTCEIAFDGVKLVTDDRGSKTGVGYVQFKTEADLQKALIKFGELMENRKMIILRCTELEFESGSSADCAAPVTKKPRHDDIDVASDPNANKFLIYMKGFSCNTIKEDIWKFLINSRIADNGNSIFFDFNSSGILIGLAFVEFETHRDMQNALQMNGRMLGPHHIEIGQSHPDELNAMFRAHRSMREKSNPPIKRDSANEQNKKSSLEKSHAPTKDLKSENKTESEVHTSTFVSLKGLPSKIKEKEIIEFFSGLPIVEGSIRFVCDDKGQTTGNGYAEFKNLEDCKNALKKTGGKIGHNGIKVDSITKSVYSDKMKDLKNNNDKKDSKELKDSNDTKTENSTSKTIPAGVLRQHWFYLRCKNFPETVTIGEMLKFFNGFDPIPESIRLHYSSDGKPTGNAVIGFPTKEMSESALKSLNHQMCRNSKVEIFLA